jgi:hypothetical protein
LARKKSDGEVAAAVEGFLTELRLSGSEVVLGALAVALAEGIDAPPPVEQGSSTVSILR